MGAFAELCAVYLRREGPLPAAFSSSDGTAFDALRRAPLDESYEARARALGIARVIEMPLAVAGRNLGTLVVGTASQKGPDRSNRALLGTLASILSTSLAQSEQLSHHYWISKRLQRAMLPAQLVSADGLTFDAAYLPAGADSDVGGDWYDAFELGPGTIGVSIGDVVGHGLEAAVVMSEIRNAIRTTAAASDSPAAVLNHVDDLVASGSIGLASAVFGVYHPQSGTFRYASAGHPPPVMLSASGRALWLPGGGVMLGLGLESAAQDVTVTIPPGATLFLYTDGLLEYGRDLIEGERALQHAIEALEATDDRYADALHDALFGQGVANADDCATLALHRADADDSRIAHFSYSSIPISAMFSRDALRQFAHRCGITGDRQFSFVEAVGEAVANAIEHGAHVAGSTFEIVACADPRSVTVEVRSPGHWLPFTPSYERGRGIPIMRAYAENLEIASTQEETRVTLTFAR